MNKLKLILLLLIIGITTSCIKETDQAPDQGSKDCDEPGYVSLQEKGDGLHLSGFIHAEVLENVSHIELSSTQPIFGFLEGTTMSYQVSGWADQITTVDDIEVWTLPFVVSQTSTNYEIIVTYYCSTDEGIVKGDTTKILYNPGSLCEPGGLAAGHEFFMPDPIINDVPPTLNDTIRSKAFNIKFQTEPPWSDNAGMLFLFPMEEIESAYLEMDDGENKLTASFNVDWYTKEWIVEEVYYGDYSYLNADISLTQITAGLSPEELAKYSFIRFVIKRCGGKEYSKLIPFKIS